MQHLIRTTIVLLFLGMSSCVTTRIEANPYQDSAENLECQRKSSWSYWWGIAPGSTQTISANPELEGTVCPCAEKALSWVKVKTSFPDFLLSLVTLGIVNHRTTTYGCARPQGGEGEI